MRVGFHWLDRVWTNEIQSPAVAAVADANSHAVTGDSPERGRRPVANSESDANAESIAAGIRSATIDNATTDADAG